ncbi:uncharacterized protein VTP21DRAFT_8106 [Calcarisporiella thermophila]|uniref:uncharacterized protein n=1 Tax=Calcarisporiella thermophila TaxID=911321 RepID=UPI00374422A1
MSTAETLPSPHASTVSLASTYSLSSYTSTSTFWLPHIATTVSASIDFHHRYKAQASIRRRKLSHFFGDHPPLDICVREIAKEGLKALLQSKLPLCYFLYSLLQEFSSENLFFFIELEQYESVAYKSRAEMLENAWRIYRTYLNECSQLEVNVDARVRRAVVEELEAGDALRAFDEAKDAVYVLLENSFSRFLRSDLFEQMGRDIGNMSIPYPPDAVDSGIELLMKYFERQEALCRSSRAGEAPSIERIDLLRSMVLGFVRTVLGMTHERTQRKRWSVSPPYPDSEAAAGAEGRVRDFFRRSSRVGRV